MGWDLAIPRQPCFLPESPVVFLNRSPSAGFALKPQPRFTIRLLFIPLFFQDPPRRDQGNLSELRVDPPRDRPSLHLSPAVPPPSFLLGTPSSHNSVTDRFGLLIGFLKVPNELCSALSPPNARAICNSCKLDFKPVLDLRRRAAPLSRVKA